MILTANHCREFTRVVTQWGQENKASVEREYLPSDMVVMKTDSILLLRAYAQIAEPDIEQPAAIFGNCPRYFSHMPRMVSYVGTENIEPGGVEAYSAQRWRSYNGQLCGGDSGGPVIQEGHLIGIVSAVETKIPWLIQGNDVFIVLATEWTEK